LQTAKIDVALAEGQSLTEGQPMSGAELGSVPLALRGSDKQSLSVPLASRGSEPSSHPNAAPRRSKRRRVIKDAAH